MVHNTVPPSPKFKNSFFAFLFGGGICTLGQAFRKLYVYLGASEENAPTLVAITLVAASAILTALGVFDKIARYAGAGTIVPITGFANAMSSPAIEFKTEGFVLGVGANIFKIAGPVIAYGTAASVIYGVIYWLTKLKQA